jgi:hypothetical protein
MSKIFFYASLIEFFLVWQQFLTGLGFSSYSLRLTRQLQKDKTCLQVQIQQLIE